jgi:hypothetical protein
MTTRTDHLVDAQQLTLPEKFELAVLSIRKSHDLMAA